VYWFGMARRLGVPTAPGTRGVPTIHADASRTDIVACRSCRWPCARRAAAPYTARPNDPTATKEFGKTTPKPAWRQPIPSPSHRIMNASERSLRQATFTPLLGRHHAETTMLQPHRGTDRRLQRRTCDYCLRSQAASAVAEILDTGTGHPLPSPTQPGTEGRHFGG
jgi:hypothetical protein